MTTVVISQPMYFPWVGFMAHMALADVFIWLDDATFSKGSFTNRIQLKSPKGRSWMTLPLARTGLDTEIRDLSLAKPCTQAHRDAVRGATRGAPHATDALRTFDAAWSDGTLCDTIINSAEEQAKAIGIAQPPALRSSAMDIAGTGSARVLDLVRAVGGTRYVTGHGARRYLDHAAFDTAGIAVDYMDYAVPPWPQSHGDFTPYVSALDMIAHVAPEDRMRYITPATQPWHSFLEHTTNDP